MLAVTLYCLIRELAAVAIADGNICLRCLGFKVTEFPLEELRTAKLIFKTASAVGSISLCTRKPISGGRSEPPIAVEEKHSVRSNDETIGAADETGLAAAV